MTTMTIADVQNEIFSEFTEKFANSKKLENIFTKNNIINILVRKILSEKRRAKPNEELELAYKNKIFAILEAEQNIITTK